MKQIVTHLYATYNRYADALRAIPWYNDVLKPVERRILLSSHLTAKQLAKCVKIVGTAIVFHPHGEKSIYDSLVRLVHRGFLIGQGNFGCEGLHPTPPAAMRYPEAKINPELNKLFSKYLDFVPWSILEIEKEPLFLPSPIPIGLMGNGITLGIGGVNITRIPRYSYNDLISRLIEILTDNTKTTIMPNIECCDVYEDSPGEFEKILTTGKGIIQIVPYAENKISHMLIKGKNPVQGFKPLLSFNEKYEKKNNIPYFEVVDLSQKNKINIQVIPRKGKVDSKFELQIMSLISSRVNIICNLVIDDLTIKTFSIDNIIMNSFDKWKTAWKNKLELDLEHLKIREFELQVVLIIRKIIEDNKTISIKRIKDIIDIYNNNKQYQLSNVTSSTIEHICKKYSIEKLIETDVDITITQKEIIEVGNDINNIFNVALNELKQMKT